MSESKLRAEPARPPRILTVVREGSDRMSSHVDWSSWYLTDEEDMGESPEEQSIISVLLSVLARLARELGWGNRYLVGADAFFAWLPDQPLVRVSPDVYVIENPPPPPLPSSWQTWLPGHSPPLLAVEIVSDEYWRKDYDEAPEKYAHLGARELVIFDPRADAAGRRSSRVALQTYHRTDDGLFVRRYAGAGPAPIQTLGLFAVVRPTPMGPRLRLARDEAGQDLVPTAEEVVQAAEQAAEAAAAERDRERTARESAERELARLRERLRNAGLE